MIKKAYKFRIYPNKFQQNLITRTLGSCRFVFNRFLSESNDSLEKSGKRPSYSKCSKGLTTLKTEYPWLAEVDSTALQTALRHLDDGFDRFFKKQNDKPTFKSKKNPVQSYTSKFTNNNIRLEDGKIKLPKLGLVRCKQSRPVPGRIISATVRKNSTGKYIVSLLVEEQPPKPFEKTGSEVGIDLGLKDLLVLSNGEIVENIRSYKSLEKRLAKAQRAVSRKEKGSANYQKAKIKVAKIHERIANIRVDYLHKVTTNLVKNHDLICLETLDVKGMQQDKNLAKSVADVSFSKLCELLEYKADWYGKTVQKVDRYFPSTQLCSSCGHRNPDLKDLSIRTWVCHECNEKHDRDFNASLNLLAEGRRLRTVGTTGIA